MRSIYLIPALVGLLHSVAFAETSHMTAVVQATCRLHGDGSNATCFLVGEPTALRTEQNQDKIVDEGENKAKVFVVTAAHVFEAIKGDKATLVLRCWNADSEEFVRDPREIALREKGQPLWTKHPKHDVAVLELSGRALEIDPLPLDALATEADFKRLEPGELVRCVGFPHAAQFDPSKPGFPLVRLGCIASYPLSPLSKNPTFLVDFNTFEGDSGGPVVIERRRASSKQTRLAILGVIHGQHMLDEKYELIYARGQIRKRLGLSIIINAQAIQETIQRHQNSSE